MGLSALENRSVVLIGVLVAGLADSFANAATILMSVITSLPVLILPLRTALWISWIIGGFSLVVLGSIVTDVRKMERWKIIAEYVVIGIAVSAVCYFLGEFAKNIPL